MTISPRDYHFGHSVFPKDFASPSLFCTPDVMEDEASKALLDYTTAVHRWVPSFTVGHHGRRNLSRKECSHSR